MAKPRIFVSSTFYDLRQIREDIERFILEMGYDSVRNETGAIAYGQERPESYAYREVELCDIIVTVIGGRFGSESREEGGLSITQKELKTALEKGVQVFIFIEQNYDKDSKYEWANKSTKKYVKLREDIFDSKGNLKYYDPGQWKSDWVQLKDFPAEQAPVEPSAPTTDKPKNA